MDKKCMLVYLRLSLFHTLLPEVALPAIIKHFFIYHYDKLLNYPPQASGLTSGFWNYLVDHQTTFQLP